MKSVMHFISRFRSLFFSIALMVLLAACMDEDDGQANQPIELAYVSIYHAAPDAPELDIVVDNRVINRNPFDYSAYSGYLNFYTGNRHIAFNDVSADSPLIDTTFNFEDNKAYSLFVINGLSDVKALLVVDSAGTPEQGNAMVRFVHLSPDAPAFDVSIEGDSTSLFSNRAFKDATPFTEIEGGTYSFQLANTDTHEAVLSGEDVEIVPGRYYTIVAKGFNNPPEGNTHVLSLDVLH